MFKKMKIKEQAVALIAVILSIWMILQISLYFILQSNTQKNISIIFNSIAQNTEMQIRDLNFQIAEICSLLSGHSVTQSYLYEYNHSEIVRGLNRANELIRDYRLRNQNIACMAIVKNDRYFLSSEKEDFPFAQLDILIDRFSTSGEIKKQFIPSFIADNKTYFAYIMPIYPTKIDYYTQEPVRNYVICIYEIKTISYSPYFFVDSSKIDLIITDANDRIMLSSDVGSHGQLRTEQTSRKKHLSSTFILEDTGWTVTVLMSLKGIQAFSDVSTLYILLMVIFNIITLLLLTRVLNGTLVRRITLLHRSISRVPSDCTDYYITYPYDDELSEIITVINHILQKINNLNQEKITTVNRLHDAELLQKETRIFYLYGQMSPHFLYNSMTCIQGMALKHNAKDIIQVTTSLSHVFRYFSNNLNISTIKQDMHFAIEYFKILNLRRKSPIELTTNIDSSLNSIPCLKMIYQPLLENVLRHAFGPLDSGSVSITSIPDDTFAIIEIADKGKGIDNIVLNHLNHELAKTNVKEIQNSDHVGLINVHMRLKLYYGKESGIKITSVPDKGTTIRITFKKQLDNNELFPLN